MNDLMAAMNPMTKLMLRASHERSTTYLTVRAAAMLLLIADAKRAGRTEPWGTGELAKVLGVAKPAITRNITTMNRYGLVWSRTRPAGQDMRLRDITITSKGEAVVACLLGELQPADTPTLAAVA